MMRKWALVVLLALVVITGSGWIKMKSLAVSIPLQEGFNWISFPLDLVHTCPEDALKNVWQYVEAIYVYRGGKWKTYHVSAPEWTHTLHDLPQDRIGVVIKVSQDCTLSIHGLPRTEIQRKTLLYKGANLVGVDYSQRVWQAFAGAPLQKIFTGEGIELSLHDTLEPGRGYWAYLAYDCIWY